MQRPHPERSDRPGFMRLCVQNRTRSQRQKGNKKPSPNSKDPDEKRAGNWQTNRRQEYKKGKLTDERIQALNNTQGWTWEG